MSLFRVGLGIAFPGMIASTPSHINETGRRPWDRLWAPIAAIVLLVAVLLASHSLFQFGINESEDTAIYLSAASSPTHGLQLTTDVGEPAGTPFTHYPILYPVLLRVGHSVGLSFPAAGWLIDFVGYLCLCAGVFWFVSQYAPRLWGLLALLLVLCAAPIYFLGELMGPDGPAVGLMMLAMCFLAQYVRNGEQRMLIACGIFLAAALLLRYASAAFIAAACLALLVPKLDSRALKFRSACVLGVIACAPLLCLLAINALYGTNATDRTLHLHLVPTASLHDLVDALSWVFLPYGIPFVLRAAALVALAVATVWAAKRSKVGAAAWIPGIFLATYLCFLLVSISLFDAATPLNDRILAPAVALICVLITVICYAAWAQGMRMMRGASIAILLICVAIGSVHARSYLKTAGQTRSVPQLRQDYASVLPVLDALPNDAAIYTNVPFDIYLITGRHARNLPRDFGYTDLAPLPEERIEEQVRRMEAQVAQTGGLILYKIRTGSQFRPKELKNYWDAGLITQTELKQRAADLLQLPGKPGFAFYSVAAAKPLQSSAYPGQK